MKLLRMGILAASVAGLIVGTGRTETDGSLPLLKIAPDARSAALGEAGVAGSRGAMTVFHNPALMAYSDYSEAAFGYTDWLLDLTLQSGALLFSGDKHAIGISFNVFSTPDLELRVLPSDDPLETFSAHDLTAGISFAYRFRESLALGATARYLNQQIYNESAYGLSFDLGAAWALNYHDVTLAVAARNLGQMSSLDVENTPLPSSALIGIAGTIVTSGDFGLGGLGDLQAYFNDDVRLHAGLEGAWKEHLFLRAGYQTGSELRSFSGGVGFGWKGYRFDYAYQPFEEDFEASHRFAIHLGF
jgi:hypothetical protein